MRATLFTSLSKEFEFTRDIAVDDDNVHVDGERESVLEHHRNDPSPAETNNSRPSTAAL